jgi:hypothetical protein
VVKKRILLQVGEAGSKMESQWVCLAVFQEKCATVQGSEETVFSNFHLISSFKKNLTAVFDRMWLEDATLIVMEISENLDFTWNKVFSRMRACLFL